ncbi:MAG: hypothetical protein RI563_01825 [Thiohalophilus sp.]|uniref:hypothetical protein n=1 Tax=Thiohalophilus sp. TaxID=3028392 RepID=UPI0028706528|nr:hypothetical protein [Thiohalophilus sp.]MDR9435587.1 hypothetical protein [Thiohalophilus sp.]
MMYKLWVALFVLLFVVGCEQQTPPTEQIYPWQITRLPDGSSRVFGIQFNHTTLESARAVLGTRYDEGLFENPDGSLSLEIYFNEVTLGGLSGKFILLLDAPPSQLQAIKQRATGSKRMESGARRYRMAPADREQLGSMAISALSYIPYTNLDEEMIRQRFGLPDDIIPLEEGKRHWLYPDKGLDLLLDDDGKELLQYVAPRDFERVRQPLLRQIDS